MITPELYFMDNAGALRAAVAQTPAAQRTQDHGGRVERHKRMEERAHASEEKRQAQEGVDVLRPASWAHLRARNPEPRLRRHWQQAAVRRTYGSRQVTRPPRSAGSRQGAGSLAGHLDVVA